VNIGDAQPREGKIPLGWEFTRKSGDECSNRVIVDCWTPGPGCISEPGPASLCKAATPLTNGFACTGECGSDLRVVVALSGKEDKTRAKSIPL